MPSPFTPLLIATAVFSLFSTLQAQEGNMNDFSAANALGGPQILEGIRNATSVTAQRIDSKIAEDRESSDSNLVITTLGEPFPVPPAEAEALKKVFTTSSTYLSPSKSCQFRANVRYAFITSPEKKVEFILCFGCGELEVKENGKVVSFGPFDGGYGEILEITKRLFPDDEFLAKFDAALLKDRPSRMQVPKP